MTVQAILRQKRSNAVATMTPDASVGDCVAELAAKKIGAVVITRDGETVEGIVSERDIVRTLAEHGAGGLAKPLSTVMTTTVKTASLDDRSTEILGVMSQGRFRHLPVMVDGKLHALISIGDVVQFRISEMEMERTALEDMVKGF